MTTEPTPDLCCTHGAKPDRILEFLEDRKAKREPADGVYRVRIPESSRAQMRVESQSVEAQRAAGVYDESLMPMVVERLAQGVREIPDVRHAATFQRLASDHLGDDMSSTYRAFCLNHDPALVVGGEWNSPETALSVVESRTESLHAHAKCDLIIGRYSSPLIELICPVNLDRERSACFHNSAQRIDVEWVQLVLAVATGEYDTTVGAALDRIDRTCWRVDRMRKLAALIESGGYQL